MFFNRSPANIGCYVKATDNLCEHWGAYEVFWERQLHMRTDHFASYASTKTYRDDAIVVVQ